MMPWVLVDLSYLAHRARHSLRGLSFEDYETGILFGFFEQLRTVCFDPRIQSNRVALFLDSRKSHRKQMWAPYKEKRTADHYTEEEREALRITRDQVAYLESEVFPAVGFPTYKQTGLESDDLMAAAARSLRVGKEAGRQGIIVTADGDLYQCITPNVHWYDPQRNLYLDLPSFRDKKNVSPKDWIMVKILAGCTSDGVGGIPGVGEKTAIKFIKGTLPTHTKAYHSIISTPGRLVMARNAALVTLPHPKTKPVMLEEPFYNPAAFFEFCAKFGMKSYTDGPRKRLWEAFFRGDMSGDEQPTPKYRKRL